jgi:hypothetical protein
MKFASMICEGEGLLTFVPHELVDAFEARGFQLFESEVRTLFMDLGGPMLVNAKNVEVKLGETLVRIPCRDIVHYDDTLIEAEPRMAGDQKYYRISGYRTSIVLTPAQRTELLGAWTADLETWKQTAEAEGRHFAEAMRGVALAQMTPPPDEALN